MAKLFGLRTPKAIDFTLGPLVIVAGFAAMLLTRGRDGFDKGLFLGASVALFALGVAMVAMASRRAKTAAQDERGAGAGSDQADELWLPSSDE